MDRLASEQPMALLGILYVLEGSTNGSKFIARKVRPAYELPATGEGSAYLDPYGDVQPARWQEFKAAMDALNLPAADVAPWWWRRRRPSTPSASWGPELLATKAAAA